MHLVHVRVWVLLHGGRDVDDPLRADGSSGLLAGSDWNRSRQVARWHWASPLWQRPGGIRRCRDLGFCLLFGLRAARLGFPAETYRCPRMQDETTRRQKHIPDLAVRSVHTLTCQPGPVGEPIPSGEVANAKPSRMFLGRCGAQTACAYASRLLSHRPLSTRSSWLMFILPCMHHFCPALPSVLTSHDCPWRAGTLNYRRPRPLSLSYCAPSLGGLLAAPYPLPLQMAPARCEDP